MHHSWTGRGDLTANASGFYGLASWSEAARHEPQTLGGEPIQFWELHGSLIEVRVRA